VIEAIVVVAVFLLGIKIGNSWGKEDRL